jgi:hypothetical protein
VPETGAPAAPSGAMDEWPSGVDIEADRKIAIAIAYSWTLLETTFLFILLSALDEPGGNTGFILWLGYAADLHKMTGIYRIPCSAPANQRRLHAAQERHYGTRGRNTKVCMVFL